MQNIKHKKRISIIIGVLVAMVGCGILSVNKAQADTHYMPDDCSSLQGCLALMSGGDTLIIRDGIYTGAENIIDNYHKPPNGTVDAYTKIQAENVGKAIFDGQGNNILVNLDSASYITFEGIIFENSSGAVVSITNSNHIKILKCGISEAGTNSEGVSGDPLFFRYNSYCLIEDTYIWGNGRYNFYILDSDYIILRRCVNRYDRGTSVGYSNQGSFRLYGTSNSLLQNCISIDSDQESYILTPSGELIVEAQPKIIWISPNGSSGKSGVNNQTRGLISLNTGKSLLGFVGDYNVAGNMFFESVFWKSKNAFWTRSGNIEDKIIIRHSTFGEIDDLSGYHDRAVESDTLGLAEVYDSLICGTGDVALRNIVSDYNSLYDNYANYSGGGIGAHDYSSENLNQINPFLNSLKYLPRIENGSDLDSNASDGGDIGANILTKIGVSGTLYGEEGYNTDTGESLWPFPNEDLIKEKMQSYSYDDGNLTGNRGFAENKFDQFGKSLTLTRYIWQYLGNQIPCEIYDECNISVPETCSDSIQNQDETGIDCGGVCEDCIVPITYNLTNFISAITNWLGIGNSNSDVNSDGIVNTRDLGVMMSGWE